MCCFIVPNSAILAMFECCFHSNQHVSTVEWLPLYTSDQELCNGAQAHSRESVYGPQGKFEFPKICRIFDNFQIFFLFSKNHQIFTKRSDTMKPAQNVFKTVVFTLIGRKKKHIDKQRGLMCQQTI